MPFFNILLLLLVGNHLLDSCYVGGVSVRGGAQTAATLGVFLGEDVALVSACSLNLTGLGQVKRARAYKSHILTKKDTKRTRRLRTTAYADATNVAAIKEMIPYK